MCGVKVIGVLHASSMDESKTGYGATVFRVAYVAKYTRQSGESWTECALCIAKAGYLFNSYMKQQNIFFLLM